MTQLMVVSALYLILASTSPVMGYYALKLQEKGAINRVFFFVCVCLTVWMLGISIIVAAPDEATRALWSRISAVGHVLIYGAMLHFTLLLTLPANQFRRKWIAPLLYLPAVVFLYILSVAPAIAGGIDQFQSVPQGWTRTTGLTVYEAGFRVYYLSVALACLVLIDRWRRKANQPDATKQANILTAASVTVFILGTMTDTLNGLWYALPLPQMVPMFLMIPVCAIFHCVRRYHFMKPPGFVRSSLILDENLRSPVFRLSSLGLILAGMSLFILEYFWWKQGDLALTSVMCALLSAAGGAILLARRKSNGLLYLEALLILVSMTVTPIHTINIVRTGGTVMWIFPLAITLCSLLFNSDALLLSSALSLLFSQIYLSSVAPRLETVIDSRTYVSRTIALFFILITAYYVHTVYVRRLRGNAAQNRTQSLLSGIVSGFSLADRENAPNMMRGLLGELSNYFDAPAVLMSIAENEFSELLGVQSYSADGSEIPPEKRGLYMQRWLEHDRECPQELRSIPHERGAALERVGKARRKPWIFIPIFKQSIPVAFFYIETFGDTEWTRDQLVALPVISRIVSDSLEKLSSEMHIKFMAYYDALTRLPNRQLFNDRAEHAIHMARRSGKHLAILFLDLDFFKAINDTMGHEGGDMLIQAIAEKLNDTLRKTDTVARFGGDEFLILLTEIADLKDISGIADKIMDIFKKPFLLKGQEVFITVSAGVSVFPSDGEDAQALIKHADIAMYMAKEKGKNQYAFCSGTMKELVQYRVNLSNHLYRALEKGELAVYYQPQINLRTEKITGLEALLRWVHPEYGLISPGEFISIAEQTGLINPIGNWVLETACQQVAAWKRKGLGDLRTAVNLSVVQLRNPGLLRQVEHIILQTGIDPEQVELEITESTTTREPDYIVRVLNDLKGLGVSLSIDDFGIEYSSLNRLKTLPFDRLKMDIQFVHGIDKSSKDQAIAMVIIGLAQNLNLKLVAEGVENTTQLDFLRSKMCDEVQGYYYYKPMPAEEIEQILEKERDKGHAQNHSASPGTAIS